MNKTNTLQDTKIEQVIQAILQVPTPENSQPWKIVVNGNKLEIFHSSARAKLATFPDDLSVLGIGMIAETIKLVCQAAGLEAQLTFLLEERTDTHPWLQVELAPAVSITPDPLAQAIFIRHSDRRLYAGGSLNDPLFQEVHREANAIQGTGLYFTNQYPDDYLQLIKNADQVTMEWDEFRHDMMRWVRFSDKTTKKTRDGMSWRSFLRGNPNPIYYLRSRLWWFASTLDWFPPSLQTLEAKFFDDSSELSPSSYDDGAGIGCITTQSDSSDDLIAAGVLTLRIWLLLNQRGYGFQPMTNVPAILYPQRLGTFSLPEHVAHLVTNGDDILRRVFGFSNQEIPIFCFRTGLAQGEYPASARTLRRTEHVTYRQ